MNTHVELEMIKTYNEGMSGGEGDSQYIYYRASDEEVKRFQSRVELSGAIQSSKSAHNETHLAQRMIIKGISEVKDTNLHVADDIKKFVEETMKKEFEALRTHFPKQPHNSHK